MTSNNRPFPTFHCDYNGKRYELLLHPDATVADLKLKLFAETGVPSSNQKIVGLKDGAIPSDQTKLSDLRLKKKA